MGRSPYEALYRHTTHYSSLGYEILSKFFFYPLIGKKNFSLNLLKCYHSSYTGAQTKNRNLKNTLHLNLSNVKSIKIKTEKVQLVQFTFINNHKAREINQKINQNIKSFIGFSSHESSGFGNSAYIPLPHLLKKGMKTYIQLPNKKRVELGTIEPLDMYEKLFVFYGRKYIVNSPNYYSKSKSYGTYFILKEMPSSIKKKIDDAFDSQNKLELFIEKNNLGELKPATLSTDNGFSDKFGTKFLKFIPHNEYNDSLLMMGPPHYVSEKDLPPEFPLYIHYNMNKNRELISPVFKWKCKKEKKQVYLNLSNFEPL